MSDVDHSRAHPAEASAEGYCSEVARARTMHVDRLEGYDRHVDRQRYAGRSSARCDADIDPCNNVRVRLRGADLGR